jgi:hypothetical protein
MALDSGPFLSDLPGIPTLRAIEAFWLEGSVLFVVIAFGVMLVCIAQHAMGAAIVIAYALFYFVVFATRRPFVKALVIIMLITAAQACLEQQQRGWHPSFTSALVSK